MNNISNTIWYQNTLNLEQDFELSFEIYLGTFLNQGDGAALIFTSQETDPTQLIGGIGGAIGSLNIKDSLVLEFDTHFNGSGSSAVDSDADTGLHHFQLNGHVAIVETNDLTNKHKELRYSNTESLANGNFRFVQASWVAETQVMTFMVEGYEDLVHTVDIDKVFSSKTDVMFGYASANGSKKTNAKVETKTYPHQVVLNHQDTNYNQEIMNSTYTLTKSIGNDDGKCNYLHFESSSLVSDHVLVNGQVLNLTDGILDLSGFNDDSLVVEFSLTQAKTSDPINLVTYQGQVLEHNYTWPEVEIPPVDPPIVPPIDPPVEPPVNPPVNPPVEPQEPPVVNKPGRPLPPETGHIIPKNSNSVIPELKPQTNELDKVVNNDKIPDRTHVLVQKEVNSIGGITTKPNPSANIIFKAGDKGVFSSNKFEMMIPLTELMVLPYVIADEGYLFTGYYNELGEVIDLNWIKANEVYTAHYRREGVQDTFKRQGDNLKSSIYISIFLILLRFVLNRDIKRRKEQRHG